jgi:hypothetical protein
LDESENEGRRLGDPFLKARVGELETSNWASREHTSVICRNTAFREILLLRSKSIDRQRDDNSRGAELK